MKRIKNSQVAVAIAAATIGSGLSGEVAAQTGTPVDIPNTPYVQFTDDLDQVGGFQPLSNPNSEFSIPASSSPFGQCADVSLPFAFQFYDSSVSTVSVCSHGAIAMTPGSRLTTTNWAPGGQDQFAADVDGWIAPWWGSVYINGNNGASFGWQVVGEAPTRYIAFEYLNMTDSSSTFSCCRWNLNLQVRLYEGLAGRIEIDYDLEDTGTASGLTASATAGMENLQGTQPIDFLPNNPLNNWSDLNANLDNTRLTFVQDPGVELVALGTNTPEFAPLGAEYDVEATIANLNVNNLGPFDVRVEVSPSVNFAPDETTDISVLNADNEPFTVTLPQYQTRTVRVPAQAPVSLGENRFYHRVCIDTGDNVNEVDESNNCVISETQTRYLPSRPDVTVDSVRIGVRQAAPEDIVPVTIQVTNVGSEPVTDMPLAVMLSGNPAISPQDSELGRTELTIAAGESIEVDLDTPLPSILNSGAYFIGAFADIDDDFLESNEANNGRAANFELAVAGGELEIITSRIPNPLVNETYSAQFTAVGGDGNYLWSITEPNGPTQDLPNPGLRLEAGEGLVFGVCGAEGPETFTVRVASAGDEALREFTLDCVSPDQPLTIVTRSVPDAIIGQEYAFGLVVTGGASANPSSLSWSATGLPNGIELTDTGVLAGTPDTPGQFDDVTVTVTDGTETDDQVLNLNIRENQNLLLDVSPLPTAQLGEEYSAQIEASGGVGRIIFSDDGGSLPRGLVLNPDGSITGIPDEVGTFEFTVRAQDNPPTGLRAQDRNEYIINVVDADQSFQIATDVLPVGTVDEVYNAAIAAVGGVGPITWTPEGTLPQGLQFNEGLEGSEELLITGTPENSDNGRFIVVTAVDALEREASKVLVISVVEAGEDVRCPNPNDERCDGFDQGGDDGGCVAVPGRTSSGIVGLMLALGFVVALRRRR